MRGEWSNGMLCSPGELELPAPAGAADGLLILAPGLAAPGTPLVEALDLRPDVVFDLDISPNRPDALCMAGVARDLAAALGETVVSPATARPSTAGRPGRRAPRPVTVEAGDLCPRFTATILEGVPDGPSPAWLARRLTLAGMRPISAVVDVSNYVMLDLGQPNHAYDLDRLGGGGLLIRRGRPGERLVTLDGEERRARRRGLRDRDATGTAGRRRRHHGRQPGPRSARAPGGCCSRRPGSPRWPSPAPGARLGLHSEARVRFERGVDPEMALRRGRPLRGPAGDGRPGQGAAARPCAGVPPSMSGTRRCPRPATVRVRTAAGQRHPRAPTSTTPT